MLDLLTDNAHLLSAFGAGIAIGVLDLFERYPIGARNNLGRKWKYFFAFIGVHALAAIFAASIAGPSDLSPVAFGILTGIVGVSVLKSTIITVPVRGEAVPVGFNLIVEKILNLLDQHLDLDAGLVSLTEIVELLKANENPDLYRYRHEVARLALTIRQKMSNEERSRLSADIESLPQTILGSLQLAMIVSQLVGMDGLKLVISQIPRTHPLDKLRASVLY